MTSEVPDVGKVTNWADDVDESPGELQYFEQLSWTEICGNVSCPAELEQLCLTLALYAAVSVAVPLPTETLPPASQSPAVFDPDIPRRPPFKAYISNISYDIQPEHIEDLFRGLQV